MEVGDIYSSNNCGDLRILEILSYDNVTVEFIETGFKKRASANNIRKGSVKDPYFKQICGVGFTGVGNFNDSCKFYKKCLRLWHGMLQRCYEPRAPHYERYGGKGVTICDEWLNFQNFAKWFSENYIEGFDIDKDLLSKGSKVYSPETCVFLPPELNNFLASLSIRRNKIKNSHSCIYVRENGKYSVTINEKGFGTYSTLEEAILVRNKEKKRLKTELANYHYSNGDIDERTYKAILEYPLWDD